jgi:hypothetical protein
MYLVPKGSAPEGILEAYLASRAISSAELTAALQASRALPAGSGELLGWSFDVIHWGARCQATGKEPRIAVSQSFISAREEPNSSEVPLLDLKLGLPTFCKRLSWIAQAIMFYQKFDPLLIRYATFAQRLEERAQASATAE